jgi:histone H2B
VKAKKLSENGSKVSRKGGGVKMAPKCRGKEVVGTVLRSTKKVVKETVQVAAIENDNQESTQDQDQNGETEDIDTPAMETFRTIPVDEKVHEEEDRVIEVSVEKPDKEAAIADSQEHVQGPSIEEPLKVLIKGDISSGAASRGQQEEPSREDEIRKEDKQVEFQ